MVAKYYGFSPEDMDKMPLETFSNYMAEIADVENLFNGRPLRDRSPRDSYEEVLEKVKKAGLAVPEER